VALRITRQVEPWFIPFAIINGTALGLSPILLPLAAARQGAGHVGLVMGAFNLGAFGAPAAGALADRYRSYRSITVACATISAVALSLALAGGLAARVVLLAVLAALAATGRVPVVAPLAAFGGVMFAWAFLSVSSPGLTGRLVPRAEGEAQGILAASSGIAGFAGSVAGGFAAARWGYPAALGIGAGATLAGLGVFSLTLLRPGLRAWASHLASATAGASNPAGR
jgi:MFS family permease